MPYQVTRRQVVTNDVLMPEVTSGSIPEEGWQYHSDGINNYVYVCASWASQLDENFPPGITGGGTIRAIYWYLQVGGPGPPSHIVDCYAMFLGDETTNAAFGQENPIDQVNGAAWTGGRSVSTANGAVTITPKNQLTGQGFDRWMKLWGNVQVNGLTLTAPDQAQGAAVAVYAPAQTILPRFDLDDIITLVKKIITKKELVADYLDESRDIIVALTKDDPRVEGQVRQAIAELEALKPEAVQERLLEVRADMHHLAAVEKILRTLTQRA